MIEWNNSKLLVKLSCFFADNVPSTVKQQQLVLSKGTKFETIVTFHSFFCLNLTLILYNSKTQNQMCDLTYNHYFFVMQKS
jgi:hypothetical protein